MARKRCVPPSSTQTLQWLKADGLVRRDAREVVPPHVEYSLTPLGREAAERVRGLADWIETSLPRIMALRGDAIAYRSLGGDAAAEAIGTPARLPEFDGSVVRALPTRRRAR